MRVFASIYGTFTKLSNTRLKENLNKEKNVKFLFPLKRNSGLEKNREARAGERKERSRVNIAPSWSPRYLGDRKG